MHERRFIRLLVALAAILSVTTALPAAATMIEPTVPDSPVVVSPTLDAPELRGVWVDAFHDGIKSPEQVDELLTWARRANLNTLFVQVRRRGDAYFNRRYEPRSEDPDLVPGFDPLQYILERAHQGPEPLQVHAWVAVLPIWHKANDPPASPLHVMNQHGLDADDPHTWLMLRDDGRAWSGEYASGSYYLDPGNPDAANHIARVVADLVGSYDLDGIHLDQARYIEGARDQRWGYNPTSVARFQRWSGRNASDIPAPSDPAWIAWRRAQVTSLVRRIYLETKATRPSLVVSAATVTWGNGPVITADWASTPAYSQVFQDWRGWLGEGIIDLVIPMTYFREEAPQASWFDAWASWMQRHPGNRAIAIGTGGYLNPVDGAMAQLRRAQAFGTLGVVLYSYATPSSEAGDPGTIRESVAVSLSEMFPHPAPVPDLTWLSHPTEGGLLVQVPGADHATVHVVGPVSRTWATDGTGRAGASNLPPGAYVLQIEGADVDQAAYTVMVHAGQVAVLRAGNRPSI